MGMPYGEYCIVLYRRCGRNLADYLKPWGQYGLARSGKVEIIALTATLGFKKGYTTLSQNKANAFNDIYHQRFLPALAESIPSVVPYAAQLYAREPPNLLYLMQTGGLEVVESARGVLQRCNLALFATVQARSSY